MKKSSAEWAKNNRERKREIGRESSYRTKYGLEPDQVELMKSGGCQLCGSTTGLAIDHCHVAGKVRGALCITCNTALERVEREGWIDAAKEYLWRNS